MMKYYFNKKMSIELGPQIGFLTSSTKRLDFSYESKQPSGALNSDFAFNKIDFGLNFGLSVDIAKHIFLGARYSIGLLDVLRDKDKQAYNRVFQISIGTKF